MPKIFYKGLTLMAAMAFLYGCSSSRMSVHGYIQDKERVDQELEGNAGFLMGTPQFDPLKKPTRKVYVLEVVKENKDAVSTTDGSTVSSQPLPLSVPSPEPTALEADSRDMYSPPQISLPQIEETIQTPSAAASSDLKSSSGEYTEYKVEKDDTLQKISKKFYDSHGKWIKIYNANRDVIKNPDRIKPGTVIKIPKL